MNMRSQSPTEHWSGRKGKTAKLEIIAKPGRPCRRGLLSVILIVALLPSCTTLAPLPCSRPAIASPLDVPAFERLRLRLGDFVTALCDCQNHDALNELAPRWEADSNSAYCPGPLRLLSIAKEGDTLVAMLFSPRSVGTARDPDTMVIFASRVGDEWYFSWPATQGPPLE